VLGADRGRHLLKNKGFNMKKHVQDIENKVDSNTKVLETQTVILNKVSDTLICVQATNETLKDLVISKM
jgi:hypothetical protein